MAKNTEPIRYIERTREYYRALGYGAPYEWACFEEVPFFPLGKHLEECTIALVTTAAPYQPDKGDQGPGAPYNASAKFYAVYSGLTKPEPDLRISHVAIDRDHTTAEDRETYFPLRALEDASRSGRIGQVSPQFFGLPTNRSIRTTIDVDSPELVRRCKDYGIDAVILVPNCPVCHQSVSIAARMLEENEIATVIMGCARDIVEHVGVPRFLFNDFPLGNSAGRPHDSHSQRQVMALALDLLTEADAPRFTVRSPLQWNGAPDWKDDYSNAANLSEEEIAIRRREFDKAKMAAKSIRKSKE